MFQKSNNFLNALDVFFKGKKTIIGILGLIVIVILELKGIETPEIITSIFAGLLGFGLGDKKGHKRG
jgi:small-conductance mechanosensitive channel